MVVAALNFTVVSSALSMTVVSRFAAGLIGGGKVAVAAAVVAKKTRRA